MKLLDVLHSPWAIQPEKLLEIQAIVDTHLRGETIDIAAVEARIGRPLQNTQTVTMRGTTALIPVTGPIFRYANLLTDVSGATSLEILATDFSAADQNPAVQQIVLVIDSPGGQANGIAEFAQLIRSASTPVTAYIDNSAASAAYWLASSADRIVMAKTAMVGSIGAVVSIDPRKSDGSVEIISSQSPNKRADVTTDAGRAQIQKLIDALAQVFVEDVALHRKVSVDTVLSDFGGGGMMLAAEAVGAGMADSIGTLETLLSDLSTSLATLGAPRMTTPSAASSDQAMTLDILHATYPALCAQLIAEGAASERARIVAVEAQSLPGHEALVAALKADGKTTAGEAAMQILAAERGKLSALSQQLHADAPTPVPHASMPRPSDENPGSSRETLHRQARDYMTQHPGTDYRAALHAVAAH